MFHSHLKMSQYHREMMPLNLSFFFKVNLKHAIVPLYFRCTILKPGLHKGGKIDIGTTFSTLCKVYIALA